MADLNTVLAPAVRGRFAVGAFNVYDAESIQGVLEAACEERSPVILITGPLEIPLLGLKNFVAVARSLTGDATVPVCLHLDHYTDPEFVLAAVEAGFPSVMMDASALSFEENVACTRGVTVVAHARGVTVEGELGKIGRVGLSGEADDGECTATDPRRAREFVERTGVDALAVNIGNAHGVYAAAPRLDFARLEEIGRTVRVPLVLHGGSGTPEPSLKRAVSLGIRKVNVATELHVAFCRTVREDLEKGGFFCGVPQPSFGSRKHRRKWFVGGCGFSGVPEGCERHPLLTAGVQPRNCPPRPHIL